METDLTLRHFSSGEEAAPESRDVGAFFGSLEVKQRKLGEFLLVRYGVWTGIRWLRLGMSEMLQ